jgi:hypothetical protein
MKCTRLHSLFFSKSLSNFLKESCDDVEIVLVGFLLLKYELPLSLNI